MAAATVSGGSPYAEPLLPVTYQPSSKETASTTITTITRTILRFVTTFLLVILVICSVIVFLSFCFPPRKPIFQLNSLSVSNFTVTKTKLAAIWVADFTVENPNVATELSLERIESVVFYKENAALAITSVEGLDVNLRGKNGVKMKFETTGYEGNQPIVEYPVLREIDEDKRTGTVRFSIRLSVWATYRTGNYWFTRRRRVLINPYCLDLNVGVEKENGSLIGSGGKKYCDVVLISDSDLGIINVF